MNHSHFVSALIASAFFASAAIAAPAQASQERFNAPVPTKIVHPTGLPRSCENTTVQLQFTIDELGVPHDVASVGALPKEVAAQLIPVVSQWRFTPANQNGRPVQVQVVMPLKLVDEAKTRFSWSGGAGSAKSGA